MKKHKAFMRMVTYALLGAFLGLVSGLVFGLIIYFVELGLCGLTDPKQCIGGFIVPVTFMGMGAGTFAGAILGGFIAIKKTK